jgi:hypothetical protein
MKFDARTILIVIAIVLAVIAGLGGHAPLWISVTLLGVALLIGPRS